MLPRSSRINRKAFPNVIKGRAFHSEYFSVRAVSSKKPRFSIVISKKVAAKAVDRNLLKRRGMAIIKGFTDKHPSFSLSVILFAKKGAAELGFSKEKAEITSLLTSLTKAS